MICSDPLLICLLLFFKSGNCIRTKPIYIGHPGQKKKQLKPKSEISENAMEKTI